mmetsp:Transcript_50489/g.107801  ORF Transcript_50489/g.107801 Transcript_50489/m.107801 type:complete len:237 (-) Transcript_50489:11-721(-)
MHACALRWRTRPVARRVPRTAGPTAQTIVSADVQRGSAAPAQISGMQARRARRAAGRRGRACGGGVRPLALARRDTSRRASRWWSWRCAPSCARRSAPRRRRSRSRRRQRACRDSTRGAQAARRRRRRRPRRGRATWRPGSRRRRREAAWRATAASPPRPSPGAAALGRPCRARLGPASRSGGTGGARPAWRPWARAGREPSSPTGPEGRSCARAAWACPSWGRARSSKGPKGAAI